MLNRILYWFVTLPSLLKVGCLSTLGVIFACSCLTVVSIPGGYARAIEIQTATAIAMQAEATQAASAPEAEDSLKSTPVASPIIDNQPTSEAVMSGPAPSEPTTSPPAVSAAASPTIDEQPTVDAMTPEVEPLSATPSPSPSLDLELANRITARVAEAYDAPVNITVNGSQALFELYEPDAVSFGDTNLTRIGLLDRSQLYAFIAMYSIFHDFPAIDQVTARIFVADSPVYEVAATRDQAYAFPREEIDLRANPSAQMLYLTAGAARMYRLFTETFIDAGIASAVSNPTGEDIAAELESWISGVSVTEALVEGEKAVVELDMSSLIALLFTPDELSSRTAREFIDDNAKMNLTYGIGALMDRFPSINTLEMTVVLNGERVAAFRCTRTAFLAIGSEPFITAVTLDDYNRILRRLDTID